VTLRDREWLDDALAAFDLLYFEGALAEVPVRIVWHTYRPAVTYTCGDYLEGRIRINRRLSSLVVPDYVVLGTVYHECLHAVVGMDHDISFELAEGRYVHRTKAALWEAYHLDAVMRPGGPPCNTPP